MVSYLKYTPSRPGNFSVGKNLLTCLKIFETKTDIESYICYFITCINQYLIDSLTIKKNGPKTEYDKIRNICLQPLRYTLKRIKLEINCNFKIKLKKKVKNTFKFEKPQVSKVLNEFNLVVFSTKTCYKKICLHC